MCSWLHITTIRREHLLSRLSTISRFIRCVDFCDCEENKKSNGLVKQTDRLEYFDVFSSLLLALLRTLHNGQLDDYARKQFIKVDAVAVDNSEM